MTRLLAALAGTCAVLVVALVTWTPTERAVQLVGFLMAFQLIVVTSRLENLHWRRR